MLEASLLSLVENLLWICLSPSTMQQRGLRNYHSSTETMHTSMRRVLSPMLQCRSIITIHSRRLSSCVPSAYSDKASSGASSNTDGSSRSSDESSSDNSSTSTRKGPPKPPPSLHRMLPLATSSPFLSPTSNSFDFPHTTSYTTERGDRVTDVELIELLRPYVADVRIDR